ncbi:MATE family efflux transporter [Lactobacillus sp.]|uniref:MATE family efflux transporter n=1 Tax=Lactobacillus sp. TaxID=1591 RepID=UPI003F0B8498
MSKNKSTIDLTSGSISLGLVKFALPLMVGNVLQQCYNLTDTLVVGRFIGKNALAAVGSAYTLMIFLTSIILGLSMGCGAFLSIKYGAKEDREFAIGNWLSFCGTGLFSILLTLLVYLLLGITANLLAIPASIQTLFNQYLLIIYAGIPATYLYNYFACSLRAIGNSAIPLVFLCLSSVLNIILCIWLVAGLRFGVPGSALATVISQYFAGFGLTIYAWHHFPKLRFKKAAMIYDQAISKSILSLAGLTALQQSIMNLGILLVQGRINSFGVNVMAAFTSAVKIDTLAYSPVQDFGNAYSTFVAQNYGAKQADRIKQGNRQASWWILAFCLVISSLVVFWAKPLLAVFTSDPEVIQIGIGYLRIEGSFYALIGFLFMFYGYFRAIDEPMISVILTIFSLGTRVLLAYFLSEVPSIGYIGIWASIPIGWALADLAGLYYLHKKAVKPAD